MLPSPCCDTFSSAMQSMSRHSKAVVGRHLVATEQSAAGHKGEEVQGLIKKKRKKATIMLHNSHYTVIFSSEIIYSQSHNGTLSSLHLIINI